MSKLADYNPIKSIKIANVELSAPRGVIVVVGPNSSGKTLCLEDIEAKLTTGHSGGIVSREMVVQGPANIDTFVDDLLKLGFIRSSPGGGPNSFSTYLPFLDGGPQDRRRKRQQNGRHSFSKDTLNKAPKTLQAAGAPNQLHSFFLYVGQALVAYLSLDARRAVCNPAPKFNHEAATPDAPLQSLLLNSVAQETLAEETGKVFGNAVWLDISSPESYQLRMSGLPNRPPVGEMNSPINAKKYLTIDSEGDGLQSYVGVCLSVMLGIRPVMLIDEPELCLHPPQAYHMGRFIGRYTGPSHSTFVATHSGHVLRGILETGSNVSVVRLTHRGNTFSAHNLSSSQLQAVVRNPRSRAEAILDGLFSKAAIVVESDGDREVYQAACEAVPGYPSLELHFVCTGGTGGFAEVCRFYSALNVPVAVIADLDAIVEPGKLATTLKALTRQPDSVGDCEALLKTTVSKIKSLPPPITEVEAKDSLLELAKLELDWQKGDDGMLRTRMNKLEGRIKRVQRLKEGGIDAYSAYPEIHSLLTQLVAECRKHGLFLVPAGELEDWVPSLIAGKVSTSATKTERAYVMAECIRQANDKEGDVWEFMTAVTNYLSQKALASAPTK